MKKRYVSRTIKILSFIIVVGFTLSFLQNFVFVNFGADKLRMEGFYKEERDTLDVVNIGASDVFFGYSCARAYQKCGYTSYSIATYQNPISIYKAEIDEMLKYQSPKQIVIEVNGILYNDDNVLTESSLRRYFDNIPLSFEKIQHLQEVVPNENMTSYIFPFVKYHSKIPTLREVYSNTKELLAFRTKESAVLKGEFIDTSTNISGDCLDVTKDFSKCSLSDMSEKYLYELLDYLDDKNLKNVIFVRYPHRIVDDDSYVRYQRSNKVEEIVTQRGYDFINFERNINEIGLDMQKDFCDNEHMNVYGQRKFTDYFGEILCKKYDLNNSTTKLKSSDKRSLENWDNAVEYYDLLFEFADDCVKNNKDYYLCETTEVMNMLNDFKMKNYN